MKLSVYGLQKEAVDMFIFDAVIFNEDRHKGNFGVLVDNEKQADTINLRVKI